MARVKHIMCDVLPAELEPYAIYFDRGGQKIVQTDGNGSAVNFSRDIFFQWSGRFKIGKEASSFSIFSTAYAANYPINSVIKGYNDFSILLYSSNKGYLMPQKNRSLKKILIVAKTVNVEKDVRLKVIRQYYYLNEDKELIMNGQLLAEKIIPVRQYKPLFYIIDIESNIKCGIGDNISITMNAIEDMNDDRYMYLAQILLIF